MEFCNSLVIAAFDEEAWLPSGKAKAASATSHSHSKVVTIIIGPRRMRVNARICYNSADFTAL